MPECKHVFIGKSDGVHCAKCGLHISASEYAKQLSQEEKPKRQPKKKVTKDD